MTMPITNETSLVVDVRWKTAYSDDIWEQLKHIGEVEDVEALQRIKIGPAFYDSDNPLDHPIFFCFCFQNDSDKSIRWILRQNPPFSKVAKPPQIPTEHIEVSKKMGGSLGLKNQIVNFLKSEPLPIATYVVRLILNRQAGWICPSLHMPASKIVSSIEDLGRGDQIEQMGIRFNNGTAGLEELAVVYDHEDDDYVVTIRGRAQLEFGDNFELPVACKLAELVVSRVFIKTEREK